MGDIRHPRAVSVRCVVKDSSIHIAALAVEEECDVFNSGVAL